MTRPELERRLEAELAVEKRTPIRTLLRRRRGVCVVCGLEPCECEAGKGGEAGAE